jgi:hypothetical protein
MIQKFLLLLSLLTLLSGSHKKHLTIETDVLVIGGGTGGTAAAIQCSRMGVKTILVEETAMLGGMLTAAGVSCTDGNDQFPGGLWEEFRQALYTHYGKNKLNTGWVSNTCFEPHVGDSIFKVWAAQEKSLQVLFSHRPKAVFKNGNRVTGASFYDKNGNTIDINAGIVIDATELGDVLAKAGAAYDLGMDDPEISGEKEAIEKNNIIQDLTWAAILKDYGAGADKTIARPANYDSTKYFCSTADAPCNGKPYVFDTKKVLDYGKLPNNKYMLNWPAHGNDFYLNVVEEQPVARNQKYELAKQHTLGFIYFLQTTLGMKHIGLADDELNGGMALIPYNREGRRVRGVVRLNINHLKNPFDYSLFRTGIAVGDYPVDHHHAQYPGSVPQIDFPSIPAFNVPLGCLVPEKNDGLIICEKGISVTNIVNGCTRLQPVVLLTGQAAGVLAAKSIKEKKRVRDVGVRDVQQELLKRKCCLVPFSDVKPTDPHWEAIQKVGLCGILKGTGKPEGWANKMFFYPDSFLKKKELIEGLKEYFKKPLTNTEYPDELVNFSTLTDVLQVYFTNNPQNGISKFIPPLIKTNSLGEMKFAFKEFSKEVFYDEPLSRKAIAALLDFYFNPFRRQVTHSGSYSGGYYFDAGTFTKEE